MDDSSQYTIFNLACLQDEIIHIQLWVLINLLYLNVINTSLIS